MKTREEIAIETSTTITEMKNQLAADNNVSQTDIVWLTLLSAAS